MKKHLQVSFALGNGQEVWIQHPDLSAAIHANERGTGSFDQVMEVADRLAHHLGLDYTDDIELELSEIHDGKRVREVELWDYTDGPQMVRSISLEATE